MVARITTNSMTLLQGRETASGSSSIAFNWRGSWSRET
jgi:hypothetical protein